MNYSIIIINGQPWCSMVGQVHYELVRIKKIYVWMCAITYMCMCACMSVCFEINYSRVTPDVTLSG